MKIAVTGGTGFIGSHVVDHLVDAGHDVVVIDVRAPHRPDVTHAPADINDLDGLLVATAGCDAVFHLAAFADVNDVAADPVGATESNVAATAKVWEACRQNGVKRAILASTVWVYGAAPDGEGALDETSPFSLEKAGHLYTASKLAAELVAQSYQELYGLDFTILRYGIPYGPRMRPALVIPKFVTMALNGDPITVHGDGSQHRNYVYVEDLARAHVLALDPAAANQVLNLEGDERVTIRHLVDSIGSALALAPDVTYSDARSGDYEGRAISNAKAAEVIGWRPTVPFAEGLRRYVDWHLEAVVPAATAAGHADPGRSEQKVTRTARSPWWQPVAVGVAAAAGILPVVMTARHGSPGDDALGVVSVVAALATLVTVQRRRAAASSVAWPVGGAAILALVWLMAQVPYAWELLPLGLLFGVVAAETFPSEWFTRATVNAAMVAAAALVGVGVVHATWSTWAAASTVAVGLAAVAARRGLALPRRVVSWRLSAATLVFTAVLGSFVGASSAGASWFGPVVAHGPRSGNEVALTFDGQDPDAMTSVLQILDAHDVKATFFAHGSEVQADPTVARQLLANGQLVEDAGYRASTALPLEVHPGDLDRSQRAFAAQLGVCPSYIRPTSGVHTPLTARLASSRSMRLVTWDVHRDRVAARNGARLAADVLESAKAGSIIRLSLGGPRQEAAVTVALPLIIQGLHDKQLEPVRLDQLLGTPGYAGRCS